MKITIPILLIIVLLGACSGPSSSVEGDAEEVQATPTEKPIAFALPNFVFQGDDPSIPIVTHNPSSEIQNTYINPGAVIHHNGQFHMFFNSFTDWPGLVQVGYMTSSDGLSWVMEQDEPVFTSDQVPFGDGEVDVSSVQVLQDGTWVMYFHTITDGQIGMAKSAGPLGPWSVLPDPLLSAGPNGSWNDRGVFWPNVIQVEDTYYMFYAGRTAANTSIGLATSQDGWTWTPYDDPTSTEDRYAHSDPILEADSDWQLFKADRPRVQHTPDGWVMIFAGAQVEQRGLALSNNGIEWTTYPDNPFLTTEDFPIPNARTWDTALLYHDGAYYYILELGSLAGTDLFLAIHEGTIRPQP